MITKAQLVIPQDKANHIFYGSSITTVSSVISVLVVLLLSVNSSVIYLSAVPGVFIAALVEYLDKKTGTGNPEYKDFWATVVGVLLVYIPLALLVHFIT